LKTNFLDSVLALVTVSSATVKRAVDEVNVHRQAQEKAAALRQPLLDHLVATGFCREDQKQAADAMLGSHDTTLQLLKAAVDRLVAQQGELAVKKANDLGSPESDPKKRPTGPSHTKQGEYNSLTTPLVGAPTSELKESDKVLLKAAGMA
jgi:hypothetical protein